MAVVAGRRVPVDAGTGLQRSAKVACRQHLLQDPLGGEEGAPQLLGSRPTGSTCIEPFAGTTARRAMVCPAHPASPPSTSTVIVSPVDRVGAVDQRVGRQAARSRRSLKPPSAVNMNSQSRVVQPPHAGEVLRRQRVARAGTPGPSPTGPPATVRGARAKDWRRGPTDPARWPPRRPRRRPLPRRPRPRRRSRCRLLSMRSTTVCAGVPQVRLGHDDPSCHCLDVPREALLDSAHRFTPIPCCSACNPRWVWVLTDPWLMSSSSAVSATESSRTKRQASASR